MDNINGLLISLKICSKILIMYVCAQLLSHFQLFVAPRSVTHQAPLPMEFSRQAYWSGLPFPTPGDLPDQKDNKNVSHNVMNVKMGALRCELSDWEISQVFSATRCVTGKLGGEKTQCHNLLFLLSFS